MGSRRSMREKQESEYAPKFFFLRSTGDNDDLHLLSSWLFDSFFGFIAGSASQMLGPFPKALRVKACCRSQCVQVQSCSCQCVSKPPVLRANIPHSCGQPGDAQPRNMCILVGSHDSWGVAVDPKGPSTPRCWPPLPLPTSRWLHRVFE